MKLLKPLLKDWHVVEHPLMSTAQPGSEYGPSTQRHLSRADSKPVGPTPLHV
jgi:hypothetical protein